MTDIIQLLPDSVANQIAAGEVIQRPASVIKELVENAVDAGADTINVLVEDAGRTAIQVIDNGKGMSETDVRLAFERHATSKIRKADDLFSLTTMGFRGEALPSIAAVAQVEVTTRQADEELGTKLRISASKVMGQQPCTCPVGSNFRVESLFFNVPARRRFLKSNQTELANIITAFERIVLVYPHINFTFHHNGTEQFNLKAASLRQRILDIFGMKMDSDLMPVEVDTTLCKVKGFVGKPEAAKKKMAHQYFFVNGRYMKHPYFAKAVQSAFERLVPHGEQVPFFIYFDVDPANIDVNIHPTKTEIKFENEQAIWQILSAAVREAVGIFNDIPSIDFDVEGRPDIPTFDDDDTPVQQPRTTYDPNYNPFNRSHQQTHTPTEGWETLYAPLQRSHEVEQSYDLFPTLDAELGNQESIIADKSPVHYQYKGQYIMTAVRSGLMVVDQHRAHIRILYERYLHQIEEKKPVSQRMLFPEAVQFGAADGHLLDTIIAELTLLGFELTALGPTSYAINAVPAGLEGINPSSLVSDMVTAAIEAGTSVVSDINHSLALTMARKAAIPHGQLLSNDEMEDIVSHLFACSNINYTPDGHSIHCIISQQEIEKRL